jgi:hypothetical protein
MIGLDTNFANRTSAVRIRKKEKECANCLSGEF